MYRLGIDIGSKTAKMVLLNEQGKLVFSQYSLHRSHVLQTFGELLGNTLWRFGNHEVQACVTGSAGMRFAQDLGLPYAQEVIASRRALQTYAPEVDVAIELGGEDAKILFLSNGVEERMNGSCAGGTGGFLDIMCGMLSVKARDFNALAAAYTHIYPIASRCAVFAQADVRPLINAGARKSDIAASVMQAIVTQTITGLACGRVIEGTVAFLGGPCEVYPELVQRFRKTLNLTHAQTKKPENAHLFVATGAALIAGEAATQRDSSFGDVCRHTGMESKETLDCQKLDLQTLKDRIATLPLEQEGTLGRLPKLFANAQELEAFKARHEQNKVPRSRLMDYEGDIFIGVDAGSTALKLVAIGSEGELLYSAYESNQGNVVETMRKTLDEFFRATPHEYDGTPLATVRRSLVCGYGEELLKAAFRLESGEVETVAHLRAAREFLMDASFVLDIGGQDIKCLRLCNGHIDDIMLNEACSSGCGALIQGFARSFGHTKWTFAAEALKAQSPVDLGTRCTVFMTSRVRHAQKEGVSTADLSAGLAYSVVRNALYKVMGFSSLSQLGDKVVVQGGTFMNDAVLRAFELESGLEVVRPDIAHLMGAYGAALLARDEHTALFDEASTSASASDSTTTKTSTSASISASDSDSDSDSDSASESTILNVYELAALKQQQSTLRCEACTNACNMSVSTFSFAGEDTSSRSALERAWSNKAKRGMREQRVTHDPGLLISGNRCERGALWVNEKFNQKAQAQAQAQAQDRCDQQALESYAKKEEGRVEQAPDDYAKQEDARARQERGRRAKKPVNMMAYEQDMLARIDTIVPERAVLLSNKPTADESSSNKPVADESAVNESAAGKHIAADSSAHEPVSDDSAGGKPVTGVPPIGEDLLVLDITQAPDKKPVLGIPPVLGLYEHWFYWYTLFTNLGFEVLPLQASSGEVYRLGAGAVLSESVCYPAKLMHGHIYRLIAQGADYLFMPSFDDARFNEDPEGNKVDENHRDAECPVVSGYGHLAAHDAEVFSKGTTTVLSTVIKGRKPSASNITELLAGAGMTAAQNVIEIALELASETEERQREQLAHKAETELELLEHNGGTGIVLLGHPYHSDPGINHGIDQMLGELGYPVFTVESLERRALARARSDARTQSAQTSPDVQTPSRAQARGQSSQEHLSKPEYLGASGCSTEQDNMTESELYEDTDFPAARWSQAKRLYSVARLVAEHPQLHAVQLHSFGCGLDAITAPTIRKIVQAAGKLYAAIKLDEMVEPATLRIRLRSLDYALKNAKGSTAQAVPAFDVSLSDASVGTLTCNDYVCDAHASDLRSCDARTNKEQNSKQYTSVEHASKNIILPPVVPADVERGLALLDNDLCYQMLAFGGQVLRWREEHEGSAAFVLSKMCKTCRGSELERVLNQALPASKCVSIVAFDESAPATTFNLANHTSADFESASPAALKGNNDKTGSNAMDAKTASLTAPRIGVLGNAAMLFTPEFNDLLLDKIKKEGAQPVLPPLDKVFASEHPLPDLLPNLYNQGIRSFIFVHSFGCWQSHVDARGALPQLKARYPDCAITFLEFDPGISQINQLSRLKLAITIAFEQEASASSFAKSNP